MNSLQIQTLKKNQGNPSCHFLIDCPFNISLGRNIVLKLNFNTWRFLLPIYLTFLDDRRKRMFR